jgi:hypothetical protein
MALTASNFFEFHQKKKVKKLEKLTQSWLEKGGDVLTSLTENLATPHKITYKIVKIVRPPPLPENKKKKKKNPAPTYLLNLAPGR